MGAVIEVDGKIYEEVVERRPASGLPGAGARRVVPAPRVIPVAEKIGHQPLDICLDAWLRWQRRDDLSLGWRGRAVMLEGDGGADSEQVYARMESEIAEAVEAMVASLPARLNWAIRRRCNLATVWRFPALVFADVLEEAEIELEKKLRRNIATRNIFD